MLPTIYTPSVLPPNSSSFSLVNLLSSLLFETMQQELMGSPSYNVGDYLGLFPSPTFSLSSTSHSPVSFTSPLPSTDETFTEEDIPVDAASLTLLYRDLAERYTLCLAQFQDAREEAEALRDENALLRFSVTKLTESLHHLSGMKQNDLVAPPRVMPILDEPCRNRLAGGPQTSPTSVLGTEEQCRFGGRVVAEEGIPLPKNISIRSRGYRKLKEGLAGNLNSQLPVSTVANGSQQVSLGNNSSKEAPPEFKVHNQGMVKTELCNKWEENGKCPYGEQCQFAHGIGELRPIIRHPRYKTEVCRMVLAGAPCSYGHRCHFRHTVLPDDRYRLLIRPT